MRVVELVNVERKDALLYYRREFRGEAVLEFFNGPLRKNLEFIIEKKPLGEEDVRVTLLEDVEYPLIPIVRTLKKFILEEDKRGRLP